MGWLSFEQGTGHVALCVDSINRLLQGQLVQALLALSACEFHMAHHWINYLKEELLILVEGTGTYTSLNSAGDRLDGAIWRDGGCLEGGQGGRVGAEHGFHLSSKGILNPLVSLGIRASHLIVVVVFLVGADGVSTQQSVGLLARLVLAGCFEEGVLVHRDVLQGVAGTAHPGHDVVLRQRVGHDVGLRLLLERGLERVGAGLQDGNI